MVASAVQAVVAEAVAVVGSVTAVPPLSPLVLLFRSLKIDLAVYLQASRAASSAAAASARSLDPSRRKAAIQQFDG